MPLVNSVANELAAKVTLAPSVIPVYANVPEVRTVPRIVVYTPDAASAATASHWPSAENLTVEPKFAELAFVESTNSLKVPFH